MVSILEFFLGRWLPVDTLPARMECVSPLLGTKWGNRGTIIIEQNTWSQRRRAMFEHIDNSREEVSLAAAMREIEKRK